MRKALRIVLVNLLVLVVGIAVIELVFGGWVGGPGYGQINIPRHPLGLSMSAAFMRAAA